MEVEQLSNEKLSNILENYSTDIIIYDTRKKKDYTLSHIVGSINISLNDEEIIKLMEVNSPAFRSAIEKYVIMIITKDTKDSDLSLLTQELFKLNNIVYLVNNYSKFAAEYPQYIKRIGSTISLPSRSTKFIPVPSTASISPPGNVLSEIIENQLYLSDSDTAFDKQLLLNNDVTTIINVAAEIQTPFIDDERFSYLVIPLRDSVNQILTYEQFMAVFSFIDSSNSNGKKVLIHCQAGISRSATFAVAYVMWKRKMSVDEAIEYVTSKRRRVAPNFGFLGQLGTFQERLMKEYPE